MSDDPDWIDELYAEGAEERPPAALDEKIRAAARQHVRHPWYRNPGRLTALATAASLVIAVSVIYFEPGPPAVEAPAPMLGSQSMQDSELDSDTVLELEEIRAAGNEEIAKTASFHPDEARHDEAADQAEKVEAAERKSMPARRSANTPTALAAGAAIPESPAAEPISEATLDKQPETAIDEEAVEAELIALCGALPGAEETREITADATGWLVIDTVGEDAHTWRCIDGAWIETTSEQQ